MLRSPVAPVLQRIRSIESKDRNPPTLRVFRVLEKCVHKMIFSSPREARRWPLPWRWPLALAPGAVVNMEERVYTGDSEALRLRVIEAMVRRRFDPVAWPAREISGGGRAAAG